MTITLGNKGNIVRLLRSYTQSRKPVFVVRRTISKKKQRQEEVIVYDYVEYNDKIKKVK